MLLENILNIVMLLPIGIFLPLAYGKKIDWKVGLLIGIGISFSIELLQLVLCVEVYLSLMILFIIVWNWYIDSNRILEKNCK